MREMLDRRLAAGDNIVDIHATSRGRPGLQDSNLNLSLSQGFIYERNTAKRFMEDVRKVCTVLGAFRLAHLSSWSVAVGRYPGSVGWLLL